MAIVVEISVGDVPRPQGFESRLDCAFSKFSVAKIAVKSVSEKHLVVVLAVHGEHFFLMHDEA